MFKNKYIQWSWMVLLLLVPFILWLLPADFFDSEGGIILCPSRLLLGIECLGCGMTRAVQHLHHFELVDAMYYNPGVVVAYPALIIIWFILVKNAIKEIRVKSKSEK